MAMGISFGSDQYDDEELSLNDCRVKNYLEDADMGFYGSPLESKKSILEAIKALPTKDKEWLKKQLNW